MKIVKIFIAMFLVFTFVSLTTCENQIINKWWVEDDVIFAAGSGSSEEQELDYVALMKNIPIYEAIIKEKIVYEYIYETIIEYITLPPETKIEYIYVEKPLPPEILLQHINVVEIEFIYFSGDQKEYNEPSPNPNGTHLKPEEIALNKLNIKEMADSLIENEMQLIILHGHANPTSNIQSELDELEKLSTFRAEEVSRELKKHNIPNLEKRMTVRGYGGGKNISSSSSATYAGLNRRVEMILIEIETVPGSGSASTRGR